MAIVKETKNSLRWFLIIVGIFGILPILNIIPTLKVNVFLGLIYLISVVFGFITLYFGLKFNDLLRTKADFMVKFFWAELAFSLVGVLYDLVNKQLKTVNLIFIAINAMILIAIINNIKRLSKEQNTVLIPPTT